MYAYTTLFAFAIYSFQLFHSSHSNFVLFPRSSLLLDYVTFRVGPASRRFHLVPYGVRVWACTVLMMLALLTVGYGGSAPVQLLGVCFSSVQGGLGEASFLALSSFYDTPRALTAWSSGTGFAGIFGYAWVFFLNYVLGLSFRATLMMANLLNLCWLYAYFWLLSDPDVSSGGGGGRGGGVGTCISDQARDGAYSPLPLQRLASGDSLNGNEPRHTSNVGGEGGREEWGGSVGELSPDESLRVGEEVAEIRAEEMTMGQRLWFTLSLWRFAVPLMLVYFAEVKGRVAWFCVRWLPWLGSSCITLLTRAPVDTTLQCRRHVRRRESAVALVVFSVC